MCVWGGWRCRPGAGMKGQGPKPPGEFETFCAGVLGLVHYRAVNSMCLVH